MGRGIRLPFEPLAHALGPIATEWGRTCPEQFIGVRREVRSDGETRVELGAVGSVAIRLGVTRRTAHRWVHDGVPLETIEPLLHRVGVHPLEIWPADYYADIDA